MGLKVPIKRKEVILDAIDAMEKGNLRISNHALIRMKERGIVLSDIKEVIYNCVRETFKDQLTEDGMTWKYVIRGMNEAKDKDIRLVLLFDVQKVLVVTAIDLTKENTNG
jgi:Domain of unknown function (DUF4258)